MENKVDIDDVINTLAQKIGALTVENAVLQARVQALTDYISDSNQDANSDSDFS